MRDLMTVETAMLHRMMEHTKTLYATHQAWVQQYAEELADIRAEIVRRQQDEARLTWTAQRLAWEEA